MTADDEFHSRRVRNLLLVAWREVRWKDSSFDEARRTVRELREAFPAGSAILSFAAGRESSKMMSAWARLSTMFLLFSDSDEKGGKHLGTAHLFGWRGLRAAAMGLLFRRMERPGGDFSKHGNKIVRSIDDAADWLEGRLAAGPVAWTRTELREAIADFVRDHPLADRHRTPQASP